VTAWSMRAKLAAWYLAVLGLATLMLVGGGWWLLAHSVVAAADSTLRARVHGVGQFILRVERELPREEVLDEFREYAHLTPGQTLLEVIDEAGTVLCQPEFAGWPELVAGLVGRGTSDPEAFSDRALSGQPFRVVTATVRAGAKSYRVVAAEPMGPAGRAVTRFGWMLAALVPLVFLVAAVGGYWISRHALAPVDRMTRAVREITVHRLDRRLDEPAADDELRRLAVTFNGMLARLESAVADMARLTAEASHELRTPVALVRTTAEVALAQDRPAVEYRQALADVVHQAERLSRLIDDLLTLARADAGLEPHDRVPLDLRDVVADAARDLEPTAARRSIAVHLDAPVDPVGVTASEASLRRLFVILLDNAVRYTPPGGVVQVAVTLANGSGAAVHVTDSGIGIDPGDRLRVFDRFYRGEAARAEAADGVGLGLSIARTIVQHHHGTIDLGAGPDGKGCHVRVTIPQSPTS
jgi:heavy metal sensor kinase